MSGLEFEPWEPEESVGKLWHAFVSTLDAPDHFEQAVATLDEMQPRLAILFRGLGGAHDVEFKAASREEARHRLSFGRAIGQGLDHIEIASFDGEVLRLPARLAILPEHPANAALYIWLTAASVFGTEPQPESDRLRQDIRSLQSADTMVRRTLTACPGLGRTYNALMQRTRQTRPLRKLPETEAALEAAILHLLGGPAPHGDLATAIAAAVRRGNADLSEFNAPRGYQSYLPVLLWPSIRPPARQAHTTKADDPDQQGGNPADDDARTIRANRKDSSQAARKDSLILHKFESILSWAEFLNVNRRVDDDDTENAKKAADDMHEVGLAQVPQKARARLRLHLDLSPEEAEFERLAGVHVYPEWDHRNKNYLPDYCRVLSGEAEIRDTASLPASTSASRRRIRKVRRQFEALRPKRVHLTRQLDGDDVDLEAAVEARVELAATGEHSDRVYISSRTQERDLAVSLLLDVSRSTESIVANRQVLDIAREAVVALAWGLDACGDEFAINAFSSLRRDRVFVHACKDYKEPMGASVEARIAGLRPSHYTRLGAAIRHASQDLAKRTRQRRLLLIITDGKPNDLDHYEGRHGIEDSHMAVREARRRNQSVFGVTIDTKSQSAFARIFGRHGFAVVPHPDKLTAALPQLYRHLVSE